MQLIRFENSIFTVQKFISMQFIVKIILSSFSVMVASWMLSGVVIRDYLSAIMVAFVLALLNMVVKPILIFLTIPVTILTLGIFLLVINAIIVLIASSLVEGFYIAGFWWAMGFSIIVSALNYLINLNDRPNYGRYR
jgi:putative membrane protein